MQTTQIEKPKSNFGEQYITRGELAAKLRCSIETLKRREKAGILIAYKFGRMVRYAISQVEKMEAGAEVSL